MGVTKESWGLNAGDTGSGWKWDANLCSLMEVRWYTNGVYTSILGSGFLWDRTWVEVRCTLGWVWDDAWIEVKCILWTGMEVRCRLEGHVCKPGLRWDSTWKERKRESWESKWSWANQETWMGVRWDQHLVEMHSLRPGLGDMRLGWTGWRWYETWMVVTQEPWDLN